MEKFYDKLKYLIDFSEEELKTKTNISGMELFNIRNNNYLVVKKEIFEEILSELEKNNI